MIQEKETINDDFIEKVYRERLDENIIGFIAEQKNIDLRQAMDIYYNSKLSGKIGRGLYGIQYLDYRYLARVLMDTEPGLFI